MHLLSLAAVLILILLGGFLIKLKPPTPAADQQIAREVVESAKKREPFLSDGFPGNREAKSTPPEMDFFSLSHFIHTVANSHRHVDSSHFSTNRDSRSCFLVKNLSHAQMPLGHSISGKNEYDELTLTDRWGTAYHIHRLDRNLIELTSAGPDKSMGTNGDLHITAKDLKYLNY